MVEDFRVGSNLLPGCVSPRWHRRPIPGLIVILVELTMIVIFRSYGSWCWWKDFVQLWFRFELFVRSFENLSHWNRCTWNRACVLQWLSHLDICSFGTSRWNPGSLGHRALPSSGVLITEMVLDPNSSRAAAQAAAWSVAKTVIEPTLPPVLLKKTVNRWDIVLQPIPITLWHFEHDWRLNTVCFR